MVRDLRRAIQQRCPIRFHYAGSEVAGVRHGHPHALYVRTRKDGVQRTYLDLWQTGGVTGSGSLPGWRRFVLDKIADVVVEGGAPFPVAEGYNPDAYDLPLEKL